MKYVPSLIIRITLTFIIFLLPINLFYLIWFKPTLLATSLVFTSYSPEIIQDSLIIGNYQLQLISACISTTAYYLLVLLILTTKDISFKKRIYLFIFGSLLIFIGNLIRIDILIILLLKNKTNWAQTLHMFFWKVISSIYVLLVWIFLTRKMDIESIPIYSDIKHLYNLSKP